MSSTLSQVIGNSLCVTHPISMGFLLLVKKSTQHMDEEKIIDREERHKRLDR